MYIEEIDKLFQRGKILPVFEHEIAEEKRLREEAVNELNVCTMFNNEGRGDTADHA